MPRFYASGCQIDSGMLDGGKVALDLIHTIRFVPLENDISFGVEHLSAVLALPAAALLAGDLRGGDEIDAQSWNAEDRGEQDRAAGGPPESRRSPSHALHLRRG